MAGWIKRPFSGVSRVALALAMFVAGIGGGMGLLSATAQDVDETIYACVNENSGSPRIIPEGASCRNNEHALNWSVGGSASVEWSAIENVPAGIANQVALDVECVECVDTAELVEGGVTGDKLAPDSVTSGKIVDGAITGDDVQDGGVGTNDVTANYSSAAAGSNPPNVVFSNQGANQVVTVDVTIPMGDDGLPRNHAVLFSGDAMVHCWSESVCAGTVMWNLTTPGTGVLASSGRAVSNWTLASYGVGTLPVHVVAVLPSGSHSVSLNVAYIASAGPGSLEVDSASLTAVDLGRQP